MSEAAVADWAEEDASDANPALMPAGEMLTLPAALAEGGRDEDAKLSACLASVGLGLTEVCDEALSGRRLAGFDGLLGVCRQV